MERRPSAARRFDRKQLGATLGDCRGITGAAGVVPAPSPGVLPASLGRPQDVPVAQIPSRPGPSHNGANESTILLILSLGLRPGHQAWCELVAALPWALQRRSMAAASSASYCMPIKCDSGQIKERVSSRGCPCDLEFHPLAPGPVRQVAFGGYKLGLVARPVNLMTITYFVTRRPNYLLLDRTSKGVSYPDRIILAAPSSLLSSKFLNFPTT